MERPKHRSWRECVALAYSTEPTPKWRQEQKKQALPGPLFDVTVLLVTLVFGAFYVFA